MKETDVFLASISQAVLDEGMTALVVFDAATGRCSYINRLARETLEVAHSAETLENLAAPELYLSDLCPKPQRSAYARVFAPDFVRHEGLSQDVLMLKKNGLPLVVNTCVRHLTLAHEQKAYLVMFEDISLQKKLQRELLAKQDEIRRAYTELLEQNKQLKELDHAKDRFIALTTHELRTPLSAVVAMTEALTLGLEESPEQHQEFIRTVHEQSLHLMELVNDVLDFAKIRAGKMDYYVEQMDLSPLIHKIVENFVPLAAQNGIHIEFDASFSSSMESSQTLTAFADQLRFREVFTNVLQNAIKYNRHGGFVRISVKDLGELLRITVSDTGVGIPSDQLAGVFNEFETVGRLAFHHKGTGLGMPISKNLMNAMGGDLTLESVEGTGSDFFIDIPTTQILSPEKYRARPGSGEDLAA
jgi:signal transduction histidine kinase